MTKTLWLLSAGAFAMASPAFAQDNSTNTGQVSAPEAGSVQAEGPAPAPGEESPVEENAGAEIIVTAQGRPQILQDVPVAVNVVSAQQLQNSGATDIRALNQLAPSLLVSSTGSESNGSARIRGVGTVGDNPGLESSVAVFVDGVYRSRSGIGLNELGEIERIEVLRGPQGTLFGRNASAGLINIISKKPNTSEQEGYAEASYGNYDFIRVAGGVTGPIGDSGLAYRLDGVYVKRDGFYRNITQGGGSEGRVNNRDRYFIRGQALYEPNDDLSVRLIGDFTRREESCCGAVYVATKETFDPTANPTTPGFNTDGAFQLSPTNRIVTILQSLGAQRTTFPPQDPYDRLVTVTPGRTYENVTKDYGVSGEINYELGGATLTSITAYRYYKAGAAGDIDYNNVDLIYRERDGNAFRRFKTFSQELRLQGSLFDDKLDWLVGAYYAKEKLRVVDNLKFGTQYGAFAACRVVSSFARPPALGGPAPGQDDPVLRNPANPGCLSPTGRAVVTAGLAPLGPAGALVLAGIDRLSTVNNVGSVRDVYDQDSENYAFFTHNIFNITDRLSLTLGLRYTHEKKELEASFNNNNTICPVQQASLGPLLANPAIPLANRVAIAGIITLSCTGNSSSTTNNLALDDSRSEDEFTGTGILSYKPNDRLLIYGSYSKGYKAGGFNLDRSALGSNPFLNPFGGAVSPRTNADVADLQFAAEKVDAYEIGAKFTGRRFNLNVAAFRQEFENFQLNTFQGSVFIVQNVQGCSDDLGGADQDASGTTGTCAADRTRPGVISQGVEAELSLFPVRDVTVTLGYTYADTEYRNNLVGTSRGQVSPLDPFLFNIPGQQISNAPESIATASMGWTPTITDSGIKGLLYVDGRLTGDFNTGSDLFPEKAQDGFVTVNARIGIRGPGQAWSLELFGQNIFNTKYQQVAFNAPFQGAGSIANTTRFGTTANQLFSSFLAEPRTYGVTVRTRF